MEFARAQGKIGDIVVFIGDKTTSGEKSKLHKGKVFEVVAKRSEAIFCELVLKDIYSSGDEIYARFGSYLVLLPTPESILIREALNKVDQLERKSEKIKEEYRMFKKLLDELDKSKVDIEKMQRGL